MNMVNEKYQQLAAHNNISDELYEISDRCESVDERIYTSDELFQSRNL